MTTYLKKRSSGLLIVVVFLLVSACGTSKYSSQKITEAQNAVEQIQQMEAMDYAETEFSKAQSLLEKARQLAEGGRHKKAGLAAEKAMLTAELAEMKTKSQKADDSLAELYENIELLKEQLKEYENE